MYRQKISTKISVVENKNKKREKKKKKKRKTKNLINLLIERILQFHKFPY